MPQLFLIQAFQEPRLLARFKTVEAAQQRVDYHLKKFKSKYFPGDQAKDCIFYDGAKNLFGQQEQTLIAGNRPIKIDNKDVLVLGITWMP